MAKNKTISSSSLHRLRVFVHKYIDYNIWMIIMDNSRCLDTHATWLLLLEANYKNHTASIQLLF